MVSNKMSKLVGREKIIIALNDNCAREGPTTTKGRVLSLFSKVEGGPEGGNPLIMALFILIVRPLSSAVPAGSEIRTIFGRRGWGSLSPG